MPFPNKPENMIKKVQTYRKRLHRAVKPLAHITNKEYSIQRCNFLSWYKYY